MTKQQHTSARDDSAVRNRTSKWLPITAHHDTSIEKYFVGNGLYWRCLRYVRVLCHSRPVMKALH